MTKTEIHTLKKKLIYIRELILEKCKYNEETKEYENGLSNEDIKRMMYKLEEQKRSDK